MIDSNMHFGCTLVCLQLTNCAGLNKGFISQPKANPSKELYSIKSLKWEWNELDRQFESDTAICFYALRNDFGDDLEYYYIGEGEHKWKPSATRKDAEAACQTHFESKLKQMLNREI